MKLLYITNGTNGAGGLERVLSIKASYLADHYKYDVTILVLNDMHKNGFYTFSPKVQFKSIHVSGNPLAYIQSYKKGIQQMVNEIQPDVISVCDDGLKAFFLPSIIKSKAKWIYERHVSKLIELKENDSVLKKIKTKSKWWLMEKLAHSYSSFVVLTDGNKKEWKSLKNLEVVANPLSFYSDISSTCKNKTVICVGKISYQKGQDILVKAWQLVNQQFPDWQLHLYGKENLEVLDTNNLSGNVHFFLPEKNIEQKYLESSIYVMSSRFEGFGMVLTEAMACGVPCVSFDCNYGPSDIIQHGIDGLIVENKNLNQLAEAIIELIEDQIKRTEMGSKAKQNVSRYNIENIAKQWDHLFKSL